MKKSVLLIAALVLATTAHAKIEPGSVADPLVSKSYVDEQIDIITETLKDIDFTSSNNYDDDKDVNITFEEVPEHIVEEITTNVLNQLELLGVFNNKEVPTTDNNNSTNITVEEKNVFEPINIPKGGILYGDKGCEIIKRSGDVQVLLQGPDGVSDVTVGIDLSHGSYVESNHLLIVPRNDGRGLKVVSDDAWFMVKGNYVIAGGH